VQPFHEEIWFHFAPANFVEKLVSFQRYMIHSRKNFDYTFNQIRNAEETPLYFDMMRNTTVDVQGASDVTVMTMGYKKSRLTVMLCILPNGYKLPSYIIFKQKTLPKKMTFPKDVVRANEKGHMNSNFMEDWIKMVWCRRPGGICNVRNM